LPSPFRSVAYLIDKYVGSVPELVAAVARTPLTADGLVVRRRTEAGANSHSLGVDAMIVQVFNHQLKLVQERLAEHDVLRPDLGLSVGDEIPEAEMLRHPSVFVIGRHFDEAVGVPVGFRAQSAFFLGPVA